MFLGSFKTIFSGKNRLILPRKFRKELGNEDRFYILLGRDGEIWGFDLINWTNQAESILKTPLSTEVGRISRLKFFSRAEECVLDNQGRFILPSEFVDKTSFNTEVLLIGAGDHFEIWDPAKWDDLVSKKLDLERI